ncbi:MAG: BON domain-containing protein [Desulfovibrio sp.]|nr:BON domain-containing protein [Desulfovibrio sp.]
MPQLSPRGGHRADHGCACRRDGDRGCIPECHRRPARGQIWTTYALSPYLRASTINVAVQDGKVTLTGYVAEDVTKELAREIAMGVTGIREVDNRIIVQFGYFPPESNSTRGYGDVIDDANITTSIKSKLLWSRHADGLATSVVTERGKVTLRGNADNMAAKNLAGRLAVNTPGVVSVDNQLVIGNVRPTGVEVAKDTAPEAGTEIADSWITTKVKSTFLYSSNVAGSNITVNTSKGVVTLSGKLSSGAERALAVELAQNVRGVKSVKSKGLTF